MRWVFLIGACLFIKLAFVQDIDHFSKDNGLSANEILTYLVDSKGIVWLGTNRGLSAYAGNKWYQITQIENRSSAKPIELETVKLIFEDRNNNLWVSTKSGLFLYNRKYWIAFTSEEEKSDYLVTDFYEDERGWIWTFREYFQDLTEEMGIVVHSGTIHIFDGSNWFQFDEDVAGTSGMKYADASTNYFTDIEVMENGDIWVSSLDGLFQFNGKKWHEHKEKEINAKKVHAIAEGLNGEIWVASENGISQFDNEKWTNYTRKDGLSNTFFHEVRVDPGGNIWAYNGSDFNFSGINILKNGESRWESFNNKELNLKGRLEAMLFHDSVVMVLMQSGVATYADGKWKTHGRDDGLKDRKYFTMMKDQKNVIWLGGNKRIYKLKGSSWETVLEMHREIEMVRLFIDNMDNIWLGTRKNGLFNKLNNKKSKHFIEGKGLTDNHTKEIFEDKQGNIWVATNAGISRFNRQ